MLHPDPDEIAAAEIFDRKWTKAKTHPEYLRQKGAFIARYGK